MFCLRGENAISIHSISRPLAYLYRRLPNPTMLEPHICGFALVAFCMMSTITQQSSRTFSSLIELRKSSTEPSLRFVLSSAIASSNWPEVKHNQYELAKGYVTHPVDPHTAQPRHAL